MPDERTNLTSTWFNSPLCGNQTAQTLVDMVQVGQWYSKHKIDQATLERPQTRKTAVESHEDGTRSNNSDNESKDEDPLPPVSEAFMIIDVEPLAFEVEASINLDAVALLDITSEKPLMNSDKLNHTQQPTDKVSMALQDDDEHIWNF
ncbi:hypothetical protein H2248_000168 [Termitomyces sp. 'cryptogamus']|nr:hypothetical protein H2248_000168 [Termitomyces sp. 'cryptogamus']